MVSRDPAIALQPGQQERSSVSKKKRKRKREKNVLVKIRLLTQFLRRELCLKYVLEIAGSGTSRGNKGKPRSVLNAAKVENGQRAEPAMKSNTPE